MFEASNIRLFYKKDFELNKKHTLKKVHLVIITNTFQKVIIYTKSLQIT